MIFLRSYENDVNQDFKREGKKLFKMIIDLSHPLENGMPVYPGTEVPELRVAAAYEKNGFKEMQIKLLSHTGTHLDCPAHFYMDGLTADRMPLEQFYGSGLVLNCSDLGSQGLIDAAFLRKYEEEMSDREFILFYTAWDQYWGSPGYFKAYPTFTEAAAARLAQMKIKGIGIDAVSIDPVAAHQYCNHRILLKEQKIIIENLRGLGQLLEREFQFSCFPLKIRDGDGSPTRAVAILK